MTKLRSAEEILHELQTTSSLMELTFKHSEKSERQAAFKDGFMHCCDLLMQFIEAVGTIHHPHRAGARTMTDDEKEAQECLLMNCAYLDQQTANYFKAGFIEGRKGYIKADKAIDVVANLLMSEWPFTKEEAKIEAKKALDFYFLL